MKTILALILAVSFTACFSGCAFTGLGSSTILYENGQPVLATSGDHTGMSYHKNGSETFFSSLTSTHSLSTKAQWDGLNGNIDALGNTAVKVGGAMAAVRSGGLVPAIPVRR